jgi:hypothetical protein
MPKSMHEHKPEPRVLYHTWHDEKTKALAIRNMSEGLDSLRIVQKAKANYYYNYEDIDTAINVRNEFTQDDYDSFRPKNAVPKNIKGRIRMSMEAYKKNFLIRNIIDLMSDFASQGIRIVHKSPSINLFYQTWWQQVQGKERSERFLSMLYRAGNVVVQRQMAKLKAVDVRDLQKTYADVDIDLDRPDKTPRNVVPWNYIFLNPLCVESVGGEMSQFSSVDRFGLKVSGTLLKKIGPNARLSEEEKEVLKSIPKPFLEALRKNKNQIIPLDPEKISVYYYKKDDWEQWADPMIAAVLDNIVLLEKMQLADLAALDGVISQIRVWAIGDMEKGLMPDKATFTLLSSILTNNVGGGAMDLVWGPDIKLIESASSAHQFLGKTKYEPVMQALYSGLGVPPTLTGSATEGGVTNNFVSLKTLIERLQYGRDVLKLFWEHELELVRQARGFKERAQVHFERMNLSDDAAEKALLVQLADRDIISHETVLERFGELPFVEKARLAKEIKQRSGERMPKKASPFHNPEKDFEFKKLALQQGTITPSETGTKLEERKPGETPLVEKELELKKQDMKERRQDRKAVMQQRKKALQVKKKKGVSGQGRPKNSSDKKKRKTRTFKPRTKASVDLNMWLFSAQRAIAEFTNKAYLRLVNKKNIRSLTTSEEDELETLKFAILWNIDELTEVTPELVNLAIASKPSVPEQVMSVYKSKVKASNMTVDEARHLQTLLYLNEKGV